MCVCMCACHCGIAPVCAVLAAEEGRWETANFSSGERKEGVVGGFSGQDGQEGVLRYVSERRTGAEGGGARG